MNTINHKSDAELCEEIRIRELRVQRLEKAMMEAEPDSDEFYRLAKEIAKEEKWIKYYNLLLRRPGYMTEEQVWSNVFG